MLAAGELRELSIDLLLFRERTLLDLDDAGAVLRDLRVDLGAEPYGILAGGDLRFAADRLALPLRVVQDLPPQVPGLAEPLLAEDADREEHGCASEEEADQCPECNQHAELPGVR